MEWNTLSLAVQCTQHNRLPRLVCSQMKGALSHGKWPKSTLTRTGRFQPESLCSRTPKSQCLRYGIEVSLYISNLAEHLIHTYSGELVVICFFHSLHSGFNFLCFSFDSMGRGLPIISKSKEPALCFVNISIFFFFSFIDFCSYLYHFLPLLALGLFCSSSSRLLKRDLTLFFETFPLF